MDSGSNGPCSGLRARFGSAVLPANQNTRVAAQGENRTFDHPPLRPLFPFSCIANKKVPKRKQRFRETSIDQVHNCRNIIAVLVHNRSDLFLIFRDSCIVRYLFLTSFYVARSAQCPAPGIKSLVVYLSCYACGF